MADGDFLGDFLWWWKKAGIFSRQGNDDGEEIEGGALFWWDPT